MTDIDEAGRAALEQALTGRGDYELFPCDPALADTAAFSDAYGVHHWANQRRVEGKPL